MEDLKAKFNEDMKELERERKIWTEAAEKVIDDVSMI